VKAGDVVLGEFPQRNDTKVRPALIVQVAPPYDDFVLCGITTQLRNQVAGVDELIEATDADSRATGLRETSLVRVAYLVTIIPEEVMGKLGEISPERLARIRSKLARFVVGV